MYKRCFHPADILLPDNCNMTKWSVVACDQYTSQPEYWKEVESFVGDAPSTLAITLPEVYLEEDDVAERIQKINKNMEEYLPNFKEYPSSLIYVERTQKNGAVRYGLVGVVDLEAYDFSKGSTSLIRATEGTVLDRIPPRVKVREGASLELPHIMILIDDPEKTVIEPITAAKKGKELVYSFDLMQDSGSIKGYVLDKDLAEKALTACDALADFNLFNNKYNTNGLEPMLFAMGDGNHSLATAKTCYENLKKEIGEEKAINHPARYALAEIVNLHDDSLVFEAIHRVAFGVDAEKLLEAFKKYCDENKADNEAQKIVCHFGGKEEVITISSPPSPIAAGTLQHFLDEYIPSVGGKIDYIHGEDVTKDLGNKDGNIGFVLEPMPKSALFKSVIIDGALPRKTFSMGEAYDKRFYLECRKIK